MHNVFRKLELPVPEITAAVNTCWSTDPYSLGAFTHYAPNGNGNGNVTTTTTPEYEPIPPLGSLDEPVVYFAGEYTPPIPSEENEQGSGKNVERLVGTVQGAWMSGVRAGEEIGLEILESL